MNSKTASLTDKVDELVRCMSEVQRKADAAMQSLLLINSHTYSVAEGEHDGYAFLLELLDAFEGEAFDICNFAQVASDARDDLAEALQSHASAEMLNSVEEDTLDGSDGSTADGTRTPD